MHAIASLTVAIATKDRPEDLTLCLTGLLNGQMLPGEVIIVDQSENNNVYPILEQFAHSAIPVKFIHQECKGLSASRNAAIASAGYTIIAFTDDDCVPDQNWVAALSQSFSLKPFPDVVCGSVLAYGDVDKGKYSVSTREGARRIDNQRRAIPWLIGTGGNCTVRTELFRRIGNFDERLGAGSPGKAAEDADFIYRSLCQGAMVRYEPDAVIYHKQQNKERRLNSRWNYGFGIGALCGIWLSKLDIYMIYILMYWLMSRLVELVKYFLKGNWGEVNQRLLNISGTFSGLAYGLFLAPDRRGIKQS